MSKVGGCWLRSYMQLGRYDEGRAAYQRLWALTREPDDELKLAYAESQISERPREPHAARRGGSSRKCSRRGPATLKALWYGGLVALELGREDAVRTRWTSLLALNPPEEVERVVRGQLADARRRGDRRRGERSRAVRTADQARPSLWAPDAPSPAWRRLLSCSSSRARRKVGRRSP